MEINIPRHNNDNNFICTQSSPFFTFVIFIDLILRRVQVYEKTSDGYQVMYPSIYNYTYVSGTCSITEIVVPSLSEL